MANILITASTFPRWEGDAVPPFVYHLASGLAAREHNVHVLAPHAKGAAFEEDLGDVKVHRFRYSSDSLESLCYGGGILQNLKHQPARWSLVPPFIISQLYALTHLVRKHRIDVINAHWFLPQGLVAAMGNTWLKRPLITTGHGGDIFASRSKAKRALVKFAAEKAARCTVNSSSMSREFQDMTGIEPTVIPMGVDISRFAYRPMRTDNPSGHPTRGRHILFVGRLVEKKGVKFLIQAMPEVLSVVPESRLTIVGDGPERAALEALVKKLAVDSCVKFEGSVPNNVLSKYYNQADMFVAPSIHDRSGDTEALGVVILEAAASGTPIIASKVGGIPDVVSDNVTGLLVEEANPEQLAKTILLMSADFSLRQRLAFNARNLVENGFSWESVVSRFDTMVRDVLYPPTLIPVTYRK